VQGFFDIPVDHLFAAPVLIKHIRRMKVPDLVILCPDPGSIKMANAFAKRLDTDFAIIDKRRTSDVSVETGHVVGEVQGKNVVIIDDMISTAGTICEAIKVARAKGARKIFVMATHPIFAADAFERLEKAAPDEIIVTDTIPLAAQDHKLKITVLSVAELLGEAIKRIRKNESVSSLFV